MTTRAEIFAEAAKRLRQDFEELVVIPHRREKGGEAEGLVRKFLEDRLPRRFGVGAGFVIDALDQLTGHNDVIMYDALNCPVYRASSSAAIYPADNVAVVVEVKSRLDGRELRNGFEKIAAVKSLAKRGHAEPLHAQTFGVIFAFESAISAGTVLNHYRKLIEEKGFGHHPDLVVVLDKGALTILANHPALGPQWNIVSSIEGLGGKDAEGSHFAAGWHEIGPGTLDFFFRFLLVSLNTFRPFADFKWADALPTRKVEVAYLFTHTNETDESLRQAALRRYEVEARRLFGLSPATDDVIHLGPPAKEGGE